MFKDYADILTVSDIQTMLGIGRNTAYKLLKQRKIKSLRVGNKYLIPKKYVIEFVLMKSSLLDGRDGAIISNIVNEPVIIEKEAS